MSKKEITDRRGKKRIIDESSLENLKKGPQSRDQGKQRVNLTLLPETVEWLGKGGNVSARIDEVVAKIKSGELVGTRQLESLAEDIKYKSAIRVKELELEVGQLKQELEKFKSSQNQVNPKLLQKIIALLEAALELKPNAGGAIKKKIKEVIALLK